MLIIFQISFRNYCVQNFESLIISQFITERRKMDQKWVPRGHFSKNLVKIIIWVERPLKDHILELLSHNDSGLQYSVDAGSKCEH